MLLPVDKPKFINHVAFKINPRSYSDLRGQLNQKKNIFKKLLRITKINVDHFDDRKVQIFQQQSHNNCKMKDKNKEKKKSKRFEFILKNKVIHINVHYKYDNAFANTPSYHINEFSPDFISDKFKYKRKDNENKDNYNNRESKNEIMSDISNKDNNLSRAEKTKSYLPVKMNSSDNSKRILPAINNNKVKYLSPEHKQLIPNNKPLRNSSSVPNYKQLNVNNNKRIVSSNPFRKNIFESKQPPLAILSNDNKSDDSKEMIKRKHNYNKLSISFSVKKQTLSSPTSPLNITPSNQPTTYNYTINRFYREQFQAYFSHRKNWKIVSAEMEGTIPINFQWKYYASHANISKCKYDSSLPKRKLRMINLFEHNYELGNKKNLFINLIKYCDKLHINVFNIIPFTIILSNNKNFEKGAKCFQEIFTFINEHYNEYSQSNKQSFILNRLYKNHFYYDPNFINCNKTYINFPLSYTSNKNYWIVKPVDLYQGKCIEILNNYQDIIKNCQKLFKGVDKFKLKSETTPNNNPIQESEDESEQSSDNEDESSAKKRKKCTRMYCSNDIVIQKYLDNPLLYNKRKFDIRCYVLVDHNLNVFFCREGHLKGSSEEYDLNITNKFVHITNHSLQKMSENFEKYEYGNEMSYNDFKMFLQKENIPLCNFDKVINEMKYLVEISMNSIGKRITTNDKYLSFEIFGYDFIIDNKFKTWILEINNNPGLGISSPVIEKLVPRMLDDAFRLTIDNVFETVYDESVFDKEKNVYRSKYHLDGFDDNENVFEFICNIMNS